MTVVISDTGVKDQDFDDVVGGFPRGSEVRETKG